MLQRTILLVVLGGGLAGTPVFAQSAGTTATISGTIQDATGAVLPGATVTLTHVATGISRTIVSESAGQYLASGLSLGSYDIEVSLAGFGTAVRRGIELTVGRHAVLDVILTVGEVTEQLVVSGDAPLVQTTSAEVEGFVSERQVKDLPLNARDLVSLATLSAGVLPADGGPREGDVRGGFGKKLSIAGTRYDANLFQLDGISIGGVSGSAGSAAGIMMGAETVQEFSVVTNAYSAEFGNHTGGVFNAVTKSGTNLLRGSVFGFLRDDSMDAKNFFDADKPDYGRTQFGATTGGPIFRDRTFLFGSYEGLRERLTTTRNFTVPSLDLREGRLEDPAGSGRLTTIPIAPAILPWLHTYPVPNGQDFRDGRAEYIAERDRPTDEDFFSLRIDHRVSDTTSLFGRYTFSDAERVPTVGLLVRQEFTTRNQFLAVGATQIVKGAVNQIVAGYSRNPGYSTQEFLPGAAFPSQTFTGIDQVGSLASLTVSGLAGLGTDDSVPRHSVFDVYQVKDDLTISRGAHSFRFGVDFQRYVTDEAASHTRGGVFVFGSLTDYLRGVADLFEAPSRGVGNTTMYPRQNLFGLYAQTDLRVKPRLTVNLGLRYEFLTDFAEENDRFANPIDPITPNMPREGLQIGPPAFINPSKKNFAPRVGLAWDVTGNGKTAVRAGAGVFHSQVFAIGNLHNALAKGVPGEEVGSITGARTAINFPDAYFSQNHLLAEEIKLEGLQYDMDQPTIYKYSLDLEREVATNTRVNVGYSGTRGVHLLRVVNMNTPEAQDVGGRLVIPPGSPFLHPLWGRVRPRTTDAESDYHALRLTVMQRFRAGLEFTAAFTWSKAIDDASNWAGSGDWSNSPGNSRYRTLKDGGLSAYDVRRNFVANFTYNLPGANLGGAAGKVFGDWQMSGILALRDGIPFTVTAQTPSHFVDVGGYPDYAGDPIQYDVRNPDAYFDPSAFTMYPPNTIGTAGRSILRGPGVANLDFVLAKQMLLTQRVRLQMRWEIFNMFNRANFSVPSGTRIFTRNGRLDPTVGRITSTSTTARQMQVGMRLVF
jgi:hypothetical protein